MGRLHYERTSEADSLAVICGSSQTAVETFINARAHTDVPAATHTHTEEMSVMVSTGEKTNHDQFSRLSVY